MVEVRFACIPSLEGVKCILEGAVEYSDSSGIAYFYDVAQGEHTYRVEPPDGMMFVEGQDVFKRTLFESGTTKIEWALIPGEPWPEDQPWLMSFTFAEIPWAMLTMLPAIVGIGLYFEPIKHVSKWLGL